MDTTCRQNSTLRSPMPATKRFDNPLRSIVGFAQQIGGAVASLHIGLGRKTTVVPGMSDRTFARLSSGQHLEDVMRWNALAHKYGGTRIRS